MDKIDEETIWLMEYTGDGFEYRLAETCRYATPAQLASIKHALPDVFEKYRPPGIATPGPVEARVTT